MFMVGRLSNSDQIWSFDRWACSTATAT